MENDPSPLDTLRQLKEWLDAGTITPAEFETLKRKLLFSESAAPAVLPPVAAEPEPAPVLPPPAPVAPAVFLPAAPPAWDPAADALNPPSEAGRPGASSSAEAAEKVPETSSVEPEAPFVAPPVYAEAVLPEAAPSRSPLATILIIGGIVALLALIAYLMLGNRESEHLTSASQTRADSVQVAPETGPQSNQIDLPPAPAPETVRVAPALPPAAAPVAPDSAPIAVVSPAPAPAATPPVDHNAVRSQIEGVLAAYYEDLKAAPFNAEQYFAPSVERFYTMQNTSPAAINEELAKSHFPEFLEAETHIEPGSLQISEPVNDGSRVVTYLEKSQAFRQSLQKHQQTRAQVRIRFDKDFKIKYLRQERLLENTFSE